MGTCKSIVTRNYLANLLLNYSDKITIKDAKWQGEYQEDDHNGNTRVISDRYYIEVASPLLPEGYNGTMDIITNMYDIKFKLDCDV